MKSDKSEKTIIVTDDVTIDWNLACVSPLCLCARSQHGNKYAPILPHLSHLRQLHLQ
jgi:hypothetical protein